MAHLKDREIHAPFHYLPLHTAPVGRSFGWKEGDLPVTESISDRLVRLPFFNDLTEADHARVVEAVQAFRP